MTLRGSVADVLSAAAASGVGVSASVVAAGVPFAVAVVVLLRGSVMGRTDSSPNCASRKRKRRARRVDGSGVRWGCGLLLKRWVNFVAEM